MMRGTDLLCLVCLFVLPPWLITLPKLFDFYHIQVSFLVNYAYSYGQVLSIDLILVTLTLWPLYDPGQGTKFFTNTLFSCTCPIVCSDWQNIQWADGIFLPGFVSSWGKVWTCCLFWSTGKSFPRVVSWPGCLILNRK